MNMVFNAYKRNSLSENLCTGCGTCAGICPDNAIQMHVKPEKGIYTPLISSVCRKCNLCFYACPGQSIDFNKLNKFIFGKTSKNILLGNYINCYIGHSTDENVRRRVSSGGLVTSLLTFALEEGIIDGALVTRMSKNDPLKPETIIARSNEEILSASQSKFCPVPANAMLKEILNVDGKFAVVGLPCHIHGIRKAEMLNKKLKRSVILHLGLFCHHGVNFLGTEFLLRTINVRKENVKKINYRGGWPSVMSIELRNGDKKTLPWPNYWSESVFRLYFFTPLRCTFCSDGTSELADISFGDPWLPEFKRGEIGKSIIISRNEVGENLLRDAESKGKIEITPCSADKVIRSQKAMIRFKKKSLKARLFLLKLFKISPNMKCELLEPRVTAYFSSILPYLCMYISNKRLLWPPIRILAHAIYRFSTDRRA